MSDCKDCPDGGIEGHVGGWLLNNIIQAQRFSVQGLWVKNDAFAAVDQVKVVYRKDQAEIQLTFKDDTPVQILHVRDEPGAQETTK